MRFQPFSSSLFPRLLPHLAFFRLFYALFSLFCFSPRPPFFCFSQIFDILPYLFVRLCSEQSRFDKCGGTRVFRAVSSFALRFAFCVLRSMFCALCSVLYVLFRPSCSLLAVMAVLLLAVMFGLRFSLAGITFLPLFRFFLLLFLLLFCVFSLICVGFHLFFCFSVPFISILCTLSALLSSMPLQNSLCDCFFAFFSFTSILPLWFLFLALFFIPEASHCFT